MDFLMHFCSLAPFPVLQLVVELTCGDGMGNAIACLAGGCFQKVGPSLIISC